jgi:hypothetical protein
MVIKVAQIGFDESQQKYPVNMTPRWWKKAIDRNFEHTKGVIRH